LRAKKAIIIPQSHGTCVPEKNIFVRGKRKAKKDTVATFFSRCIVVSQRTHTRGQSAPARLTHIPITKKQNFFRGS
jgi:hypothetical protein